ncbi:MAG TPA: HD domain-containing protein [Patescibacteria group bacterium]|jgi:uncharacterized protein|nr:HD domain-containing protein [Patescibacteria group bacterium]
MNQKEIIKKVEKFVRNKMLGEGTGHDWWHVDRVRRTAVKIAKKEKRGDLFIIQISALTHDLDDWKFQKTGTKVQVGKILKNLGLAEADVKKILYITENISFKLGTNKKKMKTIEGKIVQDADRLDAMGAIGIARLFAFGGRMRREIHNPGKKVKIYKSLKNFRWSTNTSLHHFEEKLLFLKDRMNTKTGRQLAIRRHKFMEEFLKHFHQEWNG